MELRTGLLLKLLRQRHQSQVSLDSNDTDTGHHLIISHSSSICSFDVDASSSGTAGVSVHGSTLTPHHHPHPNHSSGRR